MNGPDKFRVLLFDRTILITELRENLGECRQTNTQFRLKRQYHKSKIGCSGQRAKVLERVREGSPSGTQSQTAASARTVHLLQRNTDGGKFSKIKTLVEVIDWVIINIMIQASKIEDGIESIFAHHFFQRLDSNQTEFIRIIQTALLNRT